MTELKSDAGVDYSNLQILLANQQWQEADQETLSLMSQVLPNPDNSDMVGDMRHFPCSDLQTINQLWLEHSSGHFGFSVQKNEWESLGGKLDEIELSDNTFFDNDFATNVGWKKGTNFLNWEELDYSLNAPQGHLPAKWVNSDTIVAGSGQIYKAWKRLQHCPESSSAPITPPPASNAQSSADNAQFSTSNPPHSVSVSTEQLNQAVSTLINQLTNESNYRKLHHSYNRGTFLVLSIAGLAFTCLATIFGIIGNIDSGGKVKITVAVDGKEQPVQEPTAHQEMLWGIKRTDLWKFLTPICTTMAATLQGAVLGFPVQQRAKLHRSVKAKTDSLKSELEVQKFLGVTPEYLKEISQKLSQIKIEGSNEDGETNKEINTLTLEQINTTVAKMTEIQKELENLRQQNLSS